MDASPLYSGGPRAAHVTRAGTLGIVSADAPPLWTMLFFVAMLLAVALGPAVASHWWEYSSGSL
ncbi:MAG: hypothetical protein ACRELZ_09145 [Candidatus Rokuibacteriota bacterium]